jgi:uncharacterized membrane protein YbhN (UPF0104 family)
VLVPALRLVVSVALLVLVFSWIEPEAILGRLRELQATWVIAALGVSVVQVLGSAWRWRFTAQRLGLDLPLSEAISEYYLATFLNQTLPGGVLGDVSRAWRHARGLPATKSNPSLATQPTSASARTRSVHAVILERMSGLAVMTFVAAISALMLARRRSDGLDSGTVVVVLLCAAVAGTLLVWALRRRVRPDSPSALLIGDARRALLLGRALPIQAATSVAVVASYLIVFLMAARATGITTPGALLLPLMAVVLMAMLVPVSFAGWGVREGAAAALWGAAGLGASDGALVSVAYGLIVLVSSLPGLVPLLLTLVRDRGPGRRPHPARGGNGAPEVGAPDRASRSREG